MVTALPARSSSLLCQLVADHPGDDSNQCDDEKRVHVCPFKARVVISVLYQIRLVVSSPNHGNQGFRQNPLDHHVGHFDARVVVDLHSLPAMQDGQDSHGVLHAMLVVPLSEFHWTERVLCFHVCIIP